MEHVSLSLKQSAIVGKQSRVLGGHLKKIIFSTLQYHLIMSTGSFISESTYISFSNKYYKAVNIRWFTVSFRYYGPLHFDTSLSGFDLDWRSQGKLLHQFCFKVLHQFEYNLACFEDLLVRHTSYSFCLIQWVFKGLNFTLVSLFKRKKSLVLACIWTFTVWFL